MLFVDQDELGDPAEAGETLRAQLADTGFSHAQFSGNLAQWALVQIGAAEHQSFPAWERVECLAEGPVPFGQFHQPVHCVATIIAESIGKHPSARLALERHRSGRGGPFAPAINGGIIDPEMRSHLTGGGRAPEALFQFGVGGIELTGMRPIGAGERIPGAQLVEDGASNPPHGKSRKGQTAVDVEPLHRLQQPERTRRHQLFEGNRITHPRCNFPGGMMDEPKVAAEELTSRILVAGIAPAPPEGVGCRLGGSTRLKGWHVP